MILCLAEEKGGFGDGQPTPKVVVPSLRTSLPPGRENDTTGKARVSLSCRRAGLESREMGRSGLF
jgi:hypothetical protein